MHNPPHNQPNWQQSRLWDPAKWRHQQASQEVEESSRTSTSAGITLKKHRVRRNNVVPMLYQVRDFFFWGGVTISQWFNSMCNVHFVIINGRNVCRHSIQGAQLILWLLTCTQHTRCESASKVESAKCTCNTLQSHVQLFAPVHMCNR